MRAKIILRVILIAIVATGCSTINELSFDQLQPSGISFPNEIRSVVVATSSDLKDKEVNVITSDMSGNMKLCCDNLSKKIADANYFDKVVISDSCFKAPMDSIGNQVLFNKSDINDFINAFGVDALLLFNSVDIHFTELINNPNSSFNILSGVVRPSLQIYVPFREKPICQIIKPDTLYWTIYPDLTAQDIIDDASKYISDKCSEQIVPFWQNVHRIYYDGGMVQMRDAGVFVRENNWEEACKLWKDVYNTNKRLKAKAAFNIALFYEYNNQFDQATEWINNSEQKAKIGSDVYHNILEYKKAIEDRKNFYSKLNIQMNRFN